MSMEKFCDFAVWSKLFKISAYSLIILCLNVLHDDVNVFLM